jgi:Bacterial Ig-like domain (group 3)
MRAFVQESSNLEVGATMLVHCNDHGDRRFPRARFVLASALLGLLLLVASPGSARPSISAVGATHAALAAPVARIGIHLTTAMSRAGKIERSARVAGSGSPDDTPALGGPDHMLGFAPFPTRAIPHVAGGVTSYPFGQGVYLEERGPYSALEHGDALSPYFATVIGDKMMKFGGGSAANIMLANSCTSSSYLPSDWYNQNNICQMWDGVMKSSPAALVTNPVTLQPNPYYNENNIDDPGVKGYNFSFWLPANSPPVLIKILDPYDQCRVPNKPSGNVLGLAGDGSGNAVVVSSQFIDQCSTGYFGDINQNAGNGMWQITGQQYATALQLTLSQPYVHLVYPINPAVAPIDTNPSGVNITMSDPALASPPACPDGSDRGSDGSTGVPATVQCLGNGQIFGDDSLDGTGHGQHAFQWFSYAQVQNTSSIAQNVRLTINSVCTASPANGGNIRCGTGGNNFSLAVCKSDGTAAFVGQQGAAGAWTAGQTLGGGSGLGAATGVDLGCADPNYNTSDGYGCADGTITCYHVNAIFAVTLETLQPAAGHTYIPLTQVDNGYAGSTLSIRLFDAGDVACAGCTGLSNTLGVLAPNDDPTNLPRSNFSQSYGLDLTAPAYSGYSQIGYGRSATSVNKFFGYDPAYGCTDYNATDYGPTGPTDWPHSPPICPALNSGNLYADAVEATNSTGNLFANDTWMHFHVPISATYDPATFMPAGNSSWKMSYNISAITGTPMAVDTTTWEVSVDHRPVLIALGSSANPSLVGQSVTLSATVSPAAPSNVTPSGSVTFFDYNLSLGTSTLDGTGRASVSTSALTAGSHNITVRYSGDNYFLNTQPGSPMVQVVDAPSTSTPTATATAIPGSGMLGGASAATSGQINLTTQGTADWAHWGLIAASSFTHKAGVSGQIPTFTLPTGGTVTRYTLYGSGYTWSDGTPVASASTIYGLYLSGVGHAFQLVLPADNATAHTLKLYLALTKAQAQLSATLSDGSAAPYTNIVDNTTGSTFRTYTITYQAGSPGQTLTIAWTMLADHGSGYVQLHAAALALAPAATPTSTGTATSTSTSTATATSTVTSTATATPTNTVTATATATSTAIPAALNGSSATTSGAVNLTTLGTADWAHWGLTTVASFDHKAAVTQQIPTYTLTNGGTVGRAGLYTNNYVWSDGTPTLSGSTPTGLYLGGAGHGFQLVLPADNSTARTIKLYLGLNKVQAKLSATLSDGSAAPFTDTVDNPTGITYRTYTLTYRAAGPGQILTVTWSLLTDHGSGSMQLHAATLS